MNDNVTERLRSVFADVFEIESSMVPMEMCVSNTDNWDSLKAIVLTSTIEDEFGIEFSDQEIITLDSFEKVLGALQSRLT